MDRHPLSPTEVKRALALIEKGQQLEGHPPTAEDLNRARRILTGELTPDGARAEMRAALEALSNEEIEN